MISVCAGHGDVELHSIRGSIRVEEGGAAGVESLGGVPAARHKVVNGTHIYHRARAAILDVIAAIRENDGISAEEFSFRWIGNDGGERLTDIQPIVRKGPAGSREIAVESATGVRRVRAADRWSDGVV